MEFQNFARKIRSTFKQGAVMILYYLWIAVVLVSGEVPATIAKPYVTETACNEAGDATAAEFDADPDVKQYHLECHGVEFEAVNKARENSAREGDGGILAEGHGGIALDAPSL